MFQNFNSYELNGKLNWAISCKRIRLLWLRSSEKTPSWMQLGQQLAITIRFQCRKVAPFDDNIGRKNANWIHLAITLIILFLWSKCKPLGRGSDHKQDHLGEEIRKSSQIFRTVCEEPKVDLQNKLQDRTWWHGMCHTIPWEKESERYCKSWVCQFVDRLKLWSWTRTLRLCLMRIQRRGSNADNLSLVNYIQGFYSIRY
jgi:hypothetical protein